MSILLARDLKVQRNQHLGFEEQAVWDGEAQPCILVGEILDQLDGPLAVVESVHADQELGSEGDQQVLVEPIVLHLLPTVLARVELDVVLLDVGRQEVVSFDVHSGRNVKNHDFLSLREPEVDRVASPVHNFQTFFVGLLRPLTQELRDLLLILLGDIDGCAG